MADIKTSPVQNTPFHSSMISRLTELYFSHSAFDCYQIKKPQTWPDSQYLSLLPSKCHMNAIERMLS